MPRLCLFFYRDVIRLGVFHRSGRDRVSLAARIVIPETLQPMKFLVSLSGGRRGLGVDELFGRVAVAMRLRRLSGSIEFRWYDESP